MIELNLSLHRKARVWVGSLPQNACFNSVSILKKTLLSYSDESKILADDRFAIEIVIPRGGVVSYGLLGAEYRNYVGNDFSIEIYTSESESRKFDNSLCGDFETAFIGLPTVYADSVQKGVIEYIEKKSNFAPTGSLIFKCASHGKIGSSQDIFKQLSIIVCDYMFSKTFVKANEDYKNLILKYIK